MKEILVGVMTEKNKFLITGVVVNGFDIEQREKLSKDFEIIITTTTPSGLKRAKEIFNDDLVINYMPWDFSPFINRSLVIEITENSELKNQNSLVRTKGR